jgi:hypothetical protein
MKFDDIISRFLCEDSSREERIAALRSIPASGQYRVLDLAMSRGETDVISDEIKEGSDIESVASRAKDSYINSVREEFEGDFEGEEEDREAEFQAYVDEWVYGPVVSDDRTVAGVSTGEESMIIILSQDSKFFGYSEDELSDNWEEINDCLNWD